MTRRAARILTDYARDWLKAAAIAAATVGVLVALELAMAFVAALEAHPQ